VNLYRYVRNDPLNARDPSGASGEPISELSVYCGSNCNQQFDPAAWNQFLAGGTGLYRYTDRDQNDCYCSKMSAEAFPWIDAAGAATSQDIQNVVASLMLLSENVLMEIAGMTVVVVHANVAEYLGVVLVPSHGPGQTTQTVAGQSYASQGYIVVAGSNNGGSVNVVLHEVAHALDYKRGYESTDPAFVAAWGGISGQHAYYTAANPDYLGQTYAESFAEYQSQQYQTTLG
jgi:hypothetical protein